MSERVIWKFALPIKDVVVIQMPEHARLLSVDEQVGEARSLFLWAEVDPDAPLVDHTFYIRGTGHSLLGNEGWYLGTVVMDSGLVFHVYDESHRAR